MHRYFENRSKCYQFLLNSKFFGVTSLNSALTHVGFDGFFLLKRVELDLKKSCIVFQVKIEIDFRLFHFREVYFNYFHKCCLLYSLNYINLTSIKIKSQRSS